jgi:hypothetical protein
MTDTMLLGVHVLGLIGLVCGAIALARNRRDLTASDLSLLIWRAALLVGVLLAAFSLFAAYPLDPTHRIVGFPFMAAAWERHGDHWEDFVGPLTFPAYLANAAFAFAFPQLLLRIRKWARRSTSC